MYNVYMNVSDFEGQGLNRALLPVKHCSQELRADGINLVADSNLASLEFDCFIVHRLIRPEFLQILKEQKNKGKKIVWETDDSLHELETWNPAWQHYDEAALKVIDETKALADRIIVSTDELANAVNEPKKTVVLPNLIDLELWPEIKREPTDRLRIVWAGSKHHALDLEELGPPAEALLKEFPKGLVFLFFGDWPMDFVEFVRIKYTHLGMMVPRDAYRDKVALVQSVPTDQFPRTLCTLQPDIGVAPLRDVPFNHSKSNLKWLEYSMAQAPTVASDLPPYRKTGCLLAKTGSEWYARIKELIVDKDKRLHLAQEAHKTVKQDWSWQGKQKNKWLRFFKEISK